MAESEGFEPPIPVKVCRFSRPVPSTARPTLRGVGGFTSDYYNTEMRQQKSPLVLLRCRQRALPRIHNPPQTSVFKPFSAKICRNSFLHLGFTVTGSSNGLLCRVQSRSTSGAGALRGGFYDNSLSHP